MIKKEQYRIEKDSKKVTELAELCISYLEYTRLNSKNIDIEVITHPPFGEIHKKLVELSIALEEVSFRKGLIRDYKQQLYLINGFYASEWIE
jgi:hypothetical protein